MTFDKGHKEFHTLDMQSGWQVPPGYPPGFQQKIIAGALDEKQQARQSHAPAAYRSWNVLDRTVRA